jgi:hypothetical protein
MGRISAMAVLLLFGLMVALGAAGSAAAAGASDTTGSGPDQAQLQRCIDQGTVNGVPPTCTFDSNGNLISSSQPGPLKPGFDIAPFLVIAVLWSLVPLVIAIAVSSSRNEPVGLAVGLVVVLGWIGLLIVLYGQRRTVADVGRLVNDPSTPAAAPASTPPEASGESSGPVRERLGTLEDLYSQGVITVDERDRRRAAILDEV